MAVPVSGLRSLLLVAALATIAAPARAARPTYPATPAHPVSDTLHGRVIEDPYRWLEDDASPDVLRWSGEQNALTRAFIDAFPPRAALLERLRRLHAIPSTTTPRLHGGRLFYSKRWGSENQPRVFVRELTRKDADRLVIDPNVLSADGTVAMDWMFPSPDGRLIAYGTSRGGSEMSTLRVRRVDSGEDLAESIPHTQRASVAWDPDSRGFLYTRHPKPGEVPRGEEVFHTRVHHHRLGADPAEDRLVFGGEGRPIQETRSVRVSSDRKWVFLRTSLDWTKNDLWMRPAGSNGSFGTLASGLDGLTEADAFGKKLYLRTNVNAPRYRIMVADVTRPSPSGWRVLIGEQAGVIDDFELVNGRIAVAVTDSAVSRLLLFALDGAPLEEIRLPALGKISDLSADPDGKELFFVFSSFVHPPSVYRYDFARNGLDPIEKPEGPLEPLDFEMRRVVYTSKDGTRVPMFVVHRKGLRLDGNRPTLLTGYGGFNVSQLPTFRPQAIPWMEAGGVYALACLRGGGEFGRSWHEAGRLEHKQNVFDDFHAAAEFLVREGFTRPSRLAAQGGSNGGLLVGAALTQRPDLFAAIVCQVPLLDMVRYHRFSIARYWIPEYGSSENENQLPFLHAYSPYHHVKPGTRYPATLLTTGVEDSRVAPLHARKMAALLQARSEGEAPILLRHEESAGHGQGKPTAKRIEEAADVLSFLMIVMGVTPGS
jgi:prolyl oligopeptidase